MNRETKKVKIGEHEIELKTYLTVRESREIKDILLKNVKFEISGNEPKINDILPDIFNEMENKTISVIVVSIDSSTENILEKVLDFKNEEYEQLQKEMNIVTGEKELEIKKKK